jgi:hypothetical protein
MDTLTLVMTLTYELTSLALMRSIIDTTSNVFQESRSSVLMPV